PVHVDGSSFADREPVARDGRRDPGRLRDAVDPPDPRRPHPRRCADRSGDEGLQRRIESGATANGLDDGLQQLVSGYGWAARTVPVETGAAPRTPRRPGRRRFRRPLRLNVTEVTLYPRYLLLARRTTDVMCNNGMPQQER